MSVKMNGRHLAKFVADDEFDAIFPQVSLAHETLHGKTGPGSDFLGWVDLPVDYDKEEFARIKKAAAKIQSDSDVLVVIGIGGSYLGARAAIEALALKYAPDDDAADRNRAIDREWAPLCMLELTIDHITGKEAIELVKAKRPSGQ